MITVGCLQQEGVIMSYCHILSIKTALSNESIHRSAFPSFSALPRGQDPHTPERGRRPGESLKVSDLLRRAHQPSIMLFKVDLLR